MYKRSKVPNDSRPVHQHFKRYGRIFAVIFLNEIPCDEAYGAQDEENEDVYGRPGVLLAAPDETNDEQTRNESQIRMLHGKASGVRDGWYENTISNPINTWCIHERKYMKRDGIDCTSPCGAFSLA